MESVLDRAARVLAQHPAPALPLDELRRLVRGSGVGVSEEALLRALRRGPERFRLVDPWRGPWSALPAAIEARPGGGRHGRAPRRSSRRRRPGWASASRPGRGRRGTASAVGGHVPGLGRPWVVARPSAAAAGRPDGLRRLRQSLAHLGWTVDDDSPVEMARWCRLLHEEDRVRRRTRGGGAADG